MNIIFHHPLPLKENPKSASEIRPIKILESLSKLGYQVTLVVGYSKDRAKAIKEVKRNIKNGVRYEFMYSECSTMPTTLTDPSHLPVRPFTDLSLFRLCSKSKIPIGVFYRDIYWRFPDYGEGLSVFKKLFAKAAYYFDLWVYRSYVSKLFIPSLRMGDFIPLIGTSLFSELPPGHHCSELVDDNKNISNNKKRLKLFYVGGMSSHYELHKLFNVVSRMPDIELTLCTRKAEWLSVKESYLKPTDNIKIIHESGEEMERHLQASDVAILFVRPREYREFAVPVKLFEYLGFNKPVIASQGTLVGDFVSSNNVGWSIPYLERDLEWLLNKLLNNSAEINRVRNNVMKVSLNNTWDARTKKIEEELLK